MEDFNPLENSVFENTNFSASSDFFSELTGESNFTESGSGFPIVRDELETTPVSELLEEYGVFDLNVHSYVGADRLNNLADTVDSFEEYITGRISGIVNPNAANWETGTVAENSTLTDAISIAIDDLEEFRDSPDFQENLEIAFGEDVTANEAIEAIDSLISGEANADLEIVAMDNLETNGAFAPASSTIYLSEDFLIANEENPENISNVILEEWGHYLDSILNDSDSTGDEGEIFANLVKDFSFDLDALKAEDDRTILDIDGDNVVVEQATGRVGLTNNWTTFRSVRGSILAFKRDSTRRDLTDVYFYNGSTGLVNRYENRTTINFFNGEFIAYRGIGLTPSFGRVVQTYKASLVFNAPLWTRIS